MSKGSNRVAYVIKDEEALKLLLEGKDLKKDSSNMKGCILKEAIGSEGGKTNLEEFKTWKNLGNKQYSKVLAPIHLCTRDGEYLIMERLTDLPSERRSEARDFANKLREKVADDLNLLPRDVDVNVANIGVHPETEQLMLYDYPWIELSD